MELNKKLLVNIFDSNLLVNKLFFVAQSNCRNNYQNNYQDRSRLIAN